VTLPTGPDAPEEEPPRGPHHGSVQPIGPGPLAFFGGVGLVVGWAIRPLSLRWGTTEPEVTWLSIGIVFFVAAVVGGAAYHTWRVRRDGARLEPDRAVNRLVLAKTCALVGAGLAGGYFGFVLGHIGVADSDRTTTQMWHAGLAGFGGLLIVAAALLLEQACRVRDDRG
jgi:hypothetical protein